MAINERTEWLLIKLFFMTHLMVAAAGSPDFNRDIAPLIAKRCLECHNERDIKGEINLTTHEGFTKDTKNGRLLLDLVTQGEMLPKQKGLSQKLPDDEIRLLEEWVESCAAWPSDRMLDLYESTSDVRAGRNCLIARRLVERGVRFIQLYSGGDDTSRTPKTDTRVLRKTTAFRVPRWINPSPHC